MNRAIVVYDRVTQWWATYYPHPTDDLIQYHATRYLAEQHAKRYNRNR